MTDLSLPARWYFVALTGSMLGVLVTLLGVASPPDRVSLADAAVAAVLMAVAWLYPLSLAFKRRLFLDTSVLIAAIILLPTGLAMLAVGAGTLLSQLIRRQGWVQAIFNAAQMMAQAAVGGLLLAAFDDRIPHRPEAVGYVLLAGVAMFVVNQILVATMVAMQTGRSPLGVWREAVMDDTGMGLLGHLSQIAVGALAVFLLEAVPWALPLLVFPIVAVYLALRGWIRLRQETEGKRQQERAGLLQAQRVALLGTWDWNLSTGDSVWSDETRHILGVPRDASGTSYETLLRAIHPDDRELVNRAVHDTLRTGDAFEVEHRIVHPDGTLRFAEQRGELVFDAAAGGSRLTATIQDVTARRTLEAQLAREAFHDPVTGLPNRAFALDHLAKLLAIQLPDQAHVAVVLIEVEGASEEPAGHARDDLVLEAARRLRAGLRDGEMLARFGVSRFLVAFQPRTPDIVTERAAAMRETLDASFHLEGSAVTIHARVGAAVSSAVVTLPQDLVRAAEADLRRARVEARAVPGARVPEWSSALVSGTQLREALDRRELALYYQPEVALATGEIAGFEALIRWRHPTGVWLLPGDFLPVAELAGLTVPISRWVLEEACRAARSWSTLPGRARSLTVSVDIASGHFYHPDFVADVAKTLGNTGLSGEALRLEVTEPTVVDDVSSSRWTMEALRDLGVRVTIDDFGAGYASLGYLQRLAIDTLKLDRVLIASLEVGEAERAIVQATASLVRAFGMHAAAKGIETPSQLAWAHALGCELGQGYFFSAPLNGAQLAELLAGAARSGDLSPATLLIGKAMSDTREELTGSPDDHRGTVRSPFITR